MSTQATLTRFLYELGPDFPGLAGDEAISNSKRLSKLIGVYDQRPERTVEGGDTLQDVNIRKPLPWLKSISCPEGRRTGLGLRSQGILSPLGDRRIHRRRRESSRSCMNSTGSADDFAKDATHIEERFRELAVPFMRTCLTVSNSAHEFTPRGLSAAVAGRAKSAYRGKEEVRHSLLACGLHAALVVFTPALPCPALPSGLGSLILCSRLLRIDGLALLHECACEIVAARCVLGVFLFGLRNAVLPS